CNRFEKARQTEQRPRIEDYLGDLPEADRPLLLRELLRLELSYCRRAHESPDLREYLQRFPADAAVVQAVFEEAMAQPPSVAAASPPSGEVESSNHQMSTGPEVAGVGETDPPARLGRYSISTKLGAGSFGVVYRGYDEVLHRDVAIKVPHRHRVSQPADVEQYLVEARLLARLDHPHIVPVHDVGRTDDGLCFVVSKFIEGSDLKAMVKEARLSLTDSAQLVTAVA